MPDSVYILDANVFIEAARRYYAFDLESPFWDNLIRLAEEGRILSIDRVKAELEKGHDDLADWASNDFHNAFESTDDEDVITSYAEIMKWVYQNNQFTIAAKSQYAGSPDGWIIAYAHAKDCIVVTHEVLEENIKRKVKIPNVCKNFDIKWIDTFEMLRKLNVKLK
ncbi:MAG: DUF4411 family protein [Tissierellales bacterium]|nr:DUF4411 family protein [Tissierellales bacterium]